MTENSGVLDQEAISKMSFEDALKELESIVNKLESGSAPLADAINLYEFGSTLKAHCELILKQAQMRVEKIQITPEDGVVSTPFHDEE